MSEDEDDFDISSEENDQNVIIFLICGFEYI